MSNLCEDNNNVEVRMICRVSGLMLFFAAFVGAPALAAVQKENVNELVQVELAFGRLVMEKGVRDGFVAFLADDAIVFRPRPVAAKPLYASRPNNPKPLLSWRPEYADISKSADFGYTTGPYEFRSDRKDEKPAGYGHYVSIWKKQPDGAWRVVFDGGIEHGAVELPSADQVKTAAPTDLLEASPGMVDSGKEMKLLLAFDCNLAALSEKKGQADTLSPHLAQEVRLLRSGRLPLVGKVAVTKYLTQQSGTVNWKPEAAAVAGSGELGYTYGIMEVRTGSSEQPKIEQSSYLKIWKKSGKKWRIVLDLATPIPPEAAK